MSDKQTKRPGDEMPTRLGTTSALSSSHDNIRPPALEGAAGSVPPDPFRGHTPVNPPESDTPTFAGVDPYATSAGIPPSGAKIPPGGWSSAATSPGVGFGDDAMLAPGTRLAGRYEILNVLGRGGMGAVYRAQDQELDRLVALKVIRPELARNPAIVERFKQEIRLSHQVTHKNVVRMYDLSEDSGMRFVTMEFVEGRDLRSVIEERGKLPPAETVQILEQICRALEAAHAVGILHRDLKPQNIMLDAAGRVVVMDFGLARTIAGDGMTQSGALVGTMEYMSPEQALGKQLDQRSDIFALGLIGYEMLTGNMPFQAESALASLIRRTQQRAGSVTELDPLIPGALSSIVSKCLERDLNLRYANTGEVLRDLETWEGKRAAARLRLREKVAAGALSRRWMMGAGALVLAALAVVGVLVGRRLFVRSGAGDQAATVPAVSLAIMPFYNASEDPALDWLGPSLAEMLTSDIGDSSRVRMVSPDRLNQVLADLHIAGRSQVDVPTLKRVAEFTNAQMVLFGQYVRGGGQIRIDTTMLDLQHNTRSTMTVAVPSEKDLLSSADNLAAQVREKLATDARTLTELKAHAARPTTNSVAALRAYDDGLEMMRRGNYLAAEKQFEDATSNDPAFALAYSKLGEAYADLRHDDLAEKASRRAVQLSESLPEWERYRIEASHARVTKDTAKAIAAYEHLAAENPADNDVQLALAGLYEQTSDFNAAKRKLGMVLATDPKNVTVLLASGRVEIENGNPQGGLEYLMRALNLAIQLNNQEEKAAILQATGIAYGMLNRPEEALRNFQDSLAIKKQIGDQGGAAASLEEIASIQDSTGHPDEALASYKAALEARRAIGDQAGIGNTLIDTGSFYHDHGQPDQALSYFTQALQVERDLGDEAKQAMSLSNIGVIKLDKGEFQDALTYLDQGYQLRQRLKVPEAIAESLHNLAEAHTELGQYDQALDLYLKAIEARRSSNDERGVAIESVGMAKIFAAQGRYGAAQNSMQQAVNFIQQAKEMTSFRVEVVGGWGDLLSQIGRDNEARPSLQDALRIANQIKDDAAVAQATDWIGDAYFYKGENSAAVQQYDRALDIATKSSNKERMLLSKVNKAKVELALGHASTLIAPLKKLEQDADALGLKSTSVECAIYLGEASIATKKYAEARQQLEVAQARAEKLGLRVLEAKAHYQQAVALVANGKPADATSHYGEVVRILESISKEERSAAFLDRSDIQEIYQASIKGSRGIVGQSAALLPH